MAESRIIGDSLGKQRTDYYCNKLVQTAHKDLVKGIYSGTAEYLPVINMALEPFDLFIWLKHGKACRQLHDNAADWKEKESRKIL